MMLASEMSKLSSVSRNTNDKFKMQWEEMEKRIKESASNGLNYCQMVYGLYNEQLIAKLKENGFKVMTKMDLFHVPYGSVNCLTQYVVW